MLCTDLLQAAAWGLQFRASVFGIVQIYMQQFGSIRQSAVILYAKKCASSVEKIRLNAQGLALRLSHADIGTERFGEIIKRVLKEPTFTAVARRMSLKLRARPRTPTQEAAGESSLPKS